MGAGGMWDDSGIIVEDVCEDCLRNLEWVLVLILMRPGILVSGVVVVMVGMAVVALRIIRFGKWCLSVTEVDC